MADKLTTACIAGTFDTKAEELTFITDCLSAAGLDVMTVDLGTSGSAAAADVPAAEIAGYHPDGASSVLETSDRGAAVSAMAIAFETYVRSADWIGGIIGAGGSGGTALLAPAMRALPIGVPKVLVSTVASGNVGPYVGASDIAMMYSVTDVQGLNRISRRVLANGANALAGMMKYRIAETQDEHWPAIGLTMFGVTTTCVSHIAEKLSGAADPLVFHATGTGGQSMEKLVDSGLIDGVIDLTTTEVADMIVGGVFPATGERMGAVIRTRVPYVGSCGALDMVNFGARETVPEKYHGRSFHIHNPQVTLMRTTPEENRQFGAWIVDRLNRMDGPVRFLIPEGGVSAIDAPGQPFFDPEADLALFDTIEAGFEVTDNRKLLRVPYNINTLEFAEVALSEYRNIAGGS